MNTAFPLPYMCTTHFNCNISCPQDDDIKTPKHWHKKSLAMEKTQNTSILQVGVRGSNRNINRIKTQNDKATEY